MFSYSTEDCRCPRCNAPMPYLYKNNGSNDQICCKVCDAKSSPNENRFSKQYTLRCPYCSHALVSKKDRKYFTIHKCVNPKCSYYLHNKSKVPSDDLLGYKKNDYKLHYLYREFTVDFFKMDLDTLPKNASSLKFRKNDAHIMSLCLTLHVNLSLSLHKTAQALKDLYGINISHQMVANYARTAAVVIKPFVDHYEYPQSRVMVADETYIKVRGIKGYIWLIIDAVSEPHFVIIIIVSTCVEATIMMTAGASGSLVEEHI